MVLDEIPTATCESSEIATWKGLKFRRGHKDPPKKASLGAWILLKNLIVKILLWEYNLSCYGKFLKLIDNSSNLNKVNHGPVSVLS